MQRYVVGYINEDGTPKLQLSSIRKNGEGDGDHLKAERWEIHGVLTTDEKGRVILEELDGELTATETDSKKQKQKEK